MMPWAQAIVITTTTLTLLTTICVILRVISRFFILRKQSADDYLIIFGLMMSWTLTGFTFAEVYFGLGQHQGHVLPENLQNMFICFYFWYPVYYITLTVAKLSALFQFLRFFTMPETRLAAWILISIVCSYGIAISIASLCSCLPVESFWIANLPGNCINFTVYWYFNCSFNIVTDTAVVVLPLYVLKDLRLPRRQKWAVMGVFAIGVLTCITSVMRLVTVHILIKAGDDTYNSAPPTLWSIIEANTAIMCACMQSLKPLVQKLRPRWFMHSQSTSAVTASHSSSWKLSTIRRIANSTHEALSHQEMSGTEPMLHDRSC